MTDNQIIHEAMGKCWHEISKDYHDFGGLNNHVPVYGCKKCGEFTTSSDTSWADHPDYSTPEMLCTLLRWAREQEWWQAFCRWNNWEPIRIELNDAGKMVLKYAIPASELDQPIFSEKLAEWLRIIKTRRD
jgi:hypothetical protein